MKKNNFIKLQLFGEEDISPVEEINDPVVATEEPDKFSNLEQIVNELLIMNKDLTCKLDSFTQKYEERSKPKDVPKVYKY